MKINSIQYETFGGSATHVAANKGYEILVGGEKYLVGAVKDSSTTKPSAIDAIVSTFKKLTAPKQQETSLDVVA